VIFSQMVDDPSSVPELFPTEAAQELERKRLFTLIEELVQWENTANEEVLSRARREILESWRRTCADNKDHPRSTELFNPNELPAFHDPFAGGGSLPLEAQRLRVRSLRYRPESGGGTHQQGHDRNSSEVRRHAANKSRFEEVQDAF
jgi:putative DNA methylase